MPLTSADISRLEKLGHSASQFTRKMDDGSIRLANSESTNACVFLQTDSPDMHAQGTCSVWDDRPEGCRIYPLVLDELDQPFLDELCPYRDDFPAPPLGLQGRLLVLSETIESEVQPSD